MKVYDELVARGLIMDHHHFPIPGEVNIQFHAVRSALHRLLKSQDGIFRIPAAVASVANDLRHHSHTSCRILPHFTPHRPKVQLESSGSGKTAESAFFPLPPSLSLDGWSGRAYNWYGTESESEGANIL